MKIKATITRIKNNLMIMVSKAGQRKVMLIQISPFLKLQIVALKTTFK